MDAILIHPACIGKAPIDRLGAFTNELIRIPGAGFGANRPVIIRAFYRDELDHGIALNHIMLRPGETEFDVRVPLEDLTS